MKVFSQRLPATPSKGQLTNNNTSGLAVLSLTFDTRQKSRFSATLPSGESVLVDLPRTGVLRGGDCIATEAGDVLCIAAAPQALMQVTGQTDFALIQAAYHLGNRHVPLMLTPSALYFEPDHVLANMLTGLGLQVSPCEHAFEPESGAYQHHHDTRLAAIDLRHAT